MFDDHRRGNWTTYLYQTRDYGRNWRSIATDEIDGFVHVIEQDPVEPNLLFVGGEFGMFVSLNGGGNWFKWTHGLPTAPYRAIMVHPRDHDLVLGTHGRGVYILDDVRPLRALARNPGLTAESLHLFDIPAVYQYNEAEAIGYRSTGDAMFFGENRPYGAMITYWASDADDGDSLDIEIVDAAGDVVRTLAGSRKAGVNRVTWDLRREEFRSPSTGFGGGDGDGPLVLPGVYTVRLTQDETTVSGTVEVHPEPRTQIADAERRQKYTAIMTMGRRRELATEIVDRIRDTREAIDAIIAALEAREDSAATALAHTGRALGETLQGVSQRIVRAADGQGLFNSRELLGNRLGAVYSSLQSSWDASTQAQQTAMAQVESALQEVVDDYNAILAGDLAAFREQVNAAGLRLLPEAEALSLDWVRER